MLTIGDYANIVCIFIWIKIGEIMFKILFSNPKSKSEVKVYPVLFESQNPKPVSCTEIIEHKNKKTKYIEKILDIKLSTYLDQPRSLELEEFLGHINQYVRLNYLEAKNINKWNKCVRPLIIQYLALFSAEESHNFNSILNMLLNEIKSKIREILQDVVILSALNKAGILVHTEFNIQCVSRVNGPLILLMDGEDEFSELDKVKMLDLNSVGILSCGCVRAKIQCKDELHHFEHCLKDKKSN